MPVYEDQKETSEFVHVQTNGCAIAADRPVRFWPVIQEAQLSQRDRSMIVSLNMSLKARL